jgi:hypothetical protein
MNCCDFGCVQKMLQLVWSHIFLEILDMPHYVNGTIISFFVFFTFNVSLCLSLDFSPSLIFLTLSSLLNWICYAPTTSLCVTCAKCVFCGFCRRHFSRLLALALSCCVSDRSQAAAILPWLKMRAEWMDGDDICGDEGSRGLRAAAAGRRRRLECQEPCACSVLRMPNHYCVSFSDDDVVWNLKR